MEIYLWVSEKSEWGLFDSEDKNFKTELGKRNIYISDFATIGYSATIGDFATIGDSATIGNSAKIGYSATIGNSATIGYSATIGNSATIGDFATIGYSATIGDFATIGDSATIGNSAKIGYSATIGNSATIGYSATIGKDNLFTDYSLFYHLGLQTKEKVFTAYKAVKEDLTCYYNGEYQYKIGKGDKNTKLKLDQNIDCGEGWHFTNLEKAIEQLKDRTKDKIISAEINIKDILHISWKVRVRAFKNVQIVNIDYLR